jgi:hypothetical protein
MFVERTEEQINTLHCQIDIESFGVLESAPIITIGAVLFDPTAIDTFAFLRERALLIKIDIADAIATCGPAEPDTLKWWMTQDPAAIRALSEGEKVSVKEGMKELWRYTHSRTAQQPAWLRALPVPTNVWANSPSFDMKIINSACRKVAIKNPFFFSTERCLRTIKALAFPNGDAPDFNEGTKHDAADDAVAQSMLVQACYQELGLGRDQARFLK